MPAQQMEKGKMTVSCARSHQEHAQSLVGSQTSTSLTQAPSLQAKCRCIQLAHAWPRLETRRLPRIQQNSHSHSNSLTMQDPSHKSTHLPAALMRRLRYSFHAWNARHPAPLPRTLDQHVFEETKVVKMARRVAQQSITTLPSWTLGPRPLRVCAWQGGTLQRLQHGTAGRHADLT